MTRTLSRQAAFIAIPALVLCLPVHSQEVGKPVATRADFDNAVALLLVQRCLDCHSGPKPKGSLDLSRQQTALDGGKSGVVLVPGQPAESLLWNYVASDKMPPKKPLSAAEKNLLKVWIAGGATWGTDPIDPYRATTERRAGYDWWSLQPIAQPPLPAVQNSTWCRTPIDAFILAKLEARGLQPSPPADRRTLIRRLSFDLLGLPPTPEEVGAFVHDTAPQAYERLVDRLLSSPHYGIRWARHWLDVIRFGESNGFEFDEFRPNAWPYRDWVVKALNQDMPYDEFVRLQLAGDVLRPTDPEAITATGLLVAGAFDTVGQIQQSEAMRRVVRQDELEDLVGTVGQTFLGLTVHCARCHDHKFDPIKQVEYYRLTAALGGVRHGERDLSPLEEPVIAAKQRLAELTTQLAVLERPVRVQILAERKASSEPAPRPIAQWDFRESYQDRTGTWHGTAHGKAQRGPTGVQVDGATGYVASVPLTRELTAKTLEAWVSLENLRQRGGGVISVQTLKGEVFDALVFGEQEPGHWTAGSNNRVRTQSFRGPAETEAQRRPVHLALTYSADGTITAYRDGQVYGQPYKSSGTAHFQAGQTQVLFGLRHSPAGGNRHLAGLIHQALLYDRALSPAEVAASYRIRGDYIAPEAIVARLPADQQARWHELRAPIEEHQAFLAKQTAKAYAVNPREPEMAHLLIRGDPKQPGTVVSAGGVAALAGLSADFGLAPNAPEAARRKQLVAWITDPKNPLAARVLVNRLWHYHFGIGLVDTPNDFGFNGGRPSHPELLDWLAQELIERNGSLKQLHRRIVLSATYRQAARPNEAALRVDAGNRLLWRKNPLRMEAEVVRDAMLHVAGQLDSKMGGPGFQEFKITPAQGTPASRYLPVDPIGPEFNRRTLYRTWARAGRSGLLDAFDCPDPSTTTPSRAVTTTPLQALAMLNNRLVLYLAERWAERLAREAGPEVDAQITRAYWLAFGRPPQDHERALAQAIVQQHGLVVLARALFNSNEFLYID